MVRLFNSKAKTEEELAVEFPGFIHELTEHVSVVIARKTEMIMKGIIIILFLKLFSTPHDIALMIKLEHFLPIYRCFFYIIHFKCKLSNLLMKHNKIK
jgi:hypothetical protein